MHVPAAVLLSSFALLAACSAPPHENYYLAPTEMLEVYGTYPLSNGDVLKVSREHRRYWADMRKTGRMEIVPVDSIVFVEKGGGVRFTFKPLPFTTAVRVDGVGGPDTALASVYGQSDPRH